MNIDQIRAALAKLDPEVLRFFDSLADNEKTWAIRGIEESLRNSGKSLSMDFITQMDYDDPPVGIEEFITNPYYLGGVDIWPRWRKELLTTFDPRNQINEVIIDGGIGIGKTFNSMVMMIFKLYQLSCLRDPAGYHGLSKGSPIVFGIYNATLKLTDVGMSTLLGLLDQSPYFKEKFWYREQYNELHFPKNIKFMIGCVAEGTLIDTPTGKVPVERLEKESELVTTWDTDVVYDAPYVAVVNSGVQDCLAISTDLGHNLVCTLDHKVLVETPSGKRWKKASELRVGETVFVMQEDETGDGFLQDSGETGVPVQSVPESVRQSELQEKPSEPEETRAVDECRREDVYAVRGNEGRVGVPHPDGEVQKTYFGVPSVGVQRVRAKGEPGILGEETRARKRVGATNANGPGVPEIRGETLQRVLRGTPRRNTGKPEKAGVSETGSGPRQRKVQERRGVPGKTEIPAEKAQESALGFGPGIPGTPSEGQARLVQKKSGACAEIESRVGGQATRGEAIERRKYYPEGLGLCVGVLPVEMSVLRNDPVGGEPANCRPHHSYIAQGGEYAGKRVAVLPFMQFVEKSVKYRDFLETAKTDARTYSDRRVQTCRIAGIRRVGSRKTYDVVEVAGTHAISTNGIITSNSAAFHVLGHNLFCLAIDEMNFHMQTKKQKKAKTLEEKGKVHSLVQQTSRRMESRFATSGMIIHISSTKASNSYLEIRKREVTNNRNVHVIGGPQWEFQPKAGRRESGLTFRFVVGNKFVKPHCLDTVENLGFGQFRIKKGGHPPRGVRTIDVPVEDFRAFNEDPIGSLRDIAGIPSEAINPFFPRGQPIMEASVEWENDGESVLPHPFVAGMGARWDCPMHIDLQRPDRIQDYVLREEFLTVRSSRDVPKRMPHSPRYIHVDISRNGDAVGIAMVHPTKAVSRQVRTDTGRYDRRTELTLEVDFALQITPDTDEVDWEKIRDFILWLKEKNFVIRKVTYDSPAGQGEIQYLKKSRIEAGYLTLDRRPEQYYVFKTILNENRITWPKHEILEDELLALELTDEDKVDHPPGGSKDVSDAVCGAVWNCMQDDQVGTLLTPTADGAMTYQESTLQKVREMIQNREA